MVLSLNDKAKNHEQKNSEWSWKFQIKRNDNDECRQQ